MADISHPRVTLIVHTQPFHPKADSWPGVQAPRRVSTAACARQAPTGQDQVRVQSGLLPVTIGMLCDIGCSLALIAHDHCVRLISDADGMDCRSYYRSQLPPVPGRDLRDRIRSLCFVQMEMCRPSLIIDSD